MSVTRGHPDHSLFSFQLLPSIHLFHSSIFASLVRVRIPRIFLGFSREDESAISNIRTISGEKWAISVLERR